MGEIKRRRGRARTGEEGFTLLEIVAVLILVAALLALVGPPIMKRLDDGRVKTAQAQLAMLKSALDFYRLDIGTYPSTEEGLRALVRKPEGASPRWQGPYLDGALPVDPWGNHYVYRYPGERNPESFDLYSLGADGQEGGTGINADISLPGIEEEGVYEGLMDY
ncbi:MAG: type II secretion system major pseudopilin GspG [Firmicutes bacterium]|jgi:general secretion pathway protein G|nr:type II secretion system major pseudopilin GspG [Bacillota bacterium]